MVKRKLVQWILKLYKRERPKIEAVKVKRNIAIYFAKKYRQMKVIKVRQFFCEWAIKRAKVFWLKDTLTFALVKKYYLPYKKFMEGNLTPVEEILIQKCIRIYKRDKSILEAKKVRRNIVRFALKKYFKLKRLKEQEFNPLVSMLQAERRKELRAVIVKYCVKIYERETEFRILREDRKEMEKHIAKWAVMKY